MAGMRRIVKMQREKSVYSQLTESKNDARLFQAAAGGC